MTNNTDLDRVLYDLDILFKNSERDIKSKVEEVFNNIKSGAPTATGAAPADGTGSTSSEDNDLKKRIADLEAQVATLQKAVTMKDEIIDTQKKMIEMLEKK